VKIKFFNTTNDDVEKIEEEGLRPRLRAQFKKKKGDRTMWYDLFKQMKETTLKDVGLISPHAV